jgi:hypothetical protein
MGTKYCAHCGETRPLSEFHYNANTNTYRGPCKKCKVESQRTDESVALGFKRCTKCGETLPATSEYFKKESRNISGLANICKQCATAYTKEYYQENSEDRRDYSKRWHYAHRERALQRSRLRYRTHKKEHREKGKRWYEANREHVRETERKRYLANRERLIERTRQWRRENAERYRRYNKTWFANNPDKTAAIRKSVDTRRRARTRNLPNTFVAADWRRCLEYWGNRCAVCGSTDQLHADHWIPLVHRDCPGTVIGNMLCLCSHCNRTKSARNAILWLTEKLGEEAAKQKLAEIEAYFEYVSSSVEG